MGEHLLSQKCKIFLRYLMTETEIIKEKKRNIYSSFFSEDYVSKFLFKSILHHVISLEIYENNKLNGISFETICANIPKSIGSRSSIQSILNLSLIHI